jgi:hypothetical protein
MVVTLRNDCDAEEWLKNRRTMRERGPYEVTANLEWPTTETLDIPKDWILSKCAKCNVPILIDRERKVVHHKEPFCRWFEEAWVAADGRSDKLVKLIPSIQFRGL